MTCVLAFDTALFGCGVSVIDPAQGISVAETRRMQRGQAEHLVPMITEALEKAGKSFADVQVIGITTGPGAFTGLRIGLSTARAFGVALDIPVIGQTTLDTLAAQYLQNQSLERPLVVLIETKRKDYYAQIFDHAGQPTDKAACFSLEALVEKLPSECVLIGDCLERFNTEVLDAPSGWVFTTGYEMIDPVTLAQKTAALYEQAEDKAIFSAPEPVYLRGADVSISKKKARKIAS